MKTTSSLPAILAAAVVAAGAAGTAAARTSDGSGDTCTATGGGTNYRLQISVPSTNPEQYGFALGATKATVRSISVTAVEGSYMAEALPQGSSGTWLSASRIEPGVVIASVTTTGPTTSFSVRPASSSNPPAYFDALTCAVKAPAPAPSGAFKVASPSAWNAASGGWKLTVTVPGAGRVAAVQPEPTVGGAYPKSSTKKALVQARSVSTKGGAVTLTIRPTPLGSSTLAKGALKLKLLVTFFPTGGKASNKVVSVTLRK